MVPRLRLRLALPLMLDPKRLADLLWVNIDPRRYGAVTGDYTQGDADELARLILRENRWFVGTLAEFRELKIEVDGTVIVDSDGMGNGQDVRSGFVGTIMQYSVGQWEIVGSGATYTDIDIVFPIEVLRVGDGGGVGHVV